MRLRPERQGHVRACDFVEDRTHDGRKFRRLAEIDAITRDAGYRARIAELGGAPPGLTPGGGTSPAAFEAFIATEIRRWAEVVRVSGAQVD